MAEKVVVEVKNDKEKKKKGGVIKIILAILIVFVIIPSLVIVGFYFVDDTFMYRVNSALSDAPGPIGPYFENIPTKQEKNDQIKSIAKYYLDISKDIAVDKLLIINNDEKKMYDEIIRSMFQMDPNDTKIIIDEIRERQVKGGAVENALLEITEDRNAELAVIASDLENTPFSNLREALYEIINDGLNGESELAKILEQMDSVKAFEILSLLDDIDKENVMDSMTDQAKSAMKDVINKDISNTQKLISTSEIYASKSAEELIDILGNTSTYSIEDLAIIFKEIGVLKTGKILAKVDDDNFITNVISQMKNNEVLIDGNLNISKDILKTLNIYKEFDDNILQLTNVCLSMSSDDISGILKTFLTNGALPQVYVLESGEVIEITDEELALRVLKNFDDKRIAEILSFYEGSLASEIFKKLTVPEY